MFATLMKKFANPFKQQEGKMRDQGEFPVELLQDLDCY